MLLTLTPPLSSVSLTILSVHGDARLVWRKISRKFEPTTEASKTRLRKEFAKYELDDVTINTEEWITNIELLRGDLQKIEAHIENS